MTHPSRGSDPYTSHAAALSIDTNQMEAMVLEAVAKFPNGCIADDIKAMFPHIRRHSLVPRFAPLLRCGAIIDTGETRIASSGRSQRVVQFVPEPYRVSVPRKPKRRNKALTAEIVRECAKVIEQHYEPVYDGGILLKHFGIGGEA